ncbi:hypothetical protein Scep_018703 [Stephania cephalantha]|uniref:Uncharacterized protein n=1 Tax=Stephania cephalantha TaxID=152367 RepID=A0AAP0I9F1_9MAGN
MAGGEQRSTQHRIRAAGRQRRDRIRDDDGQRRPISTGEEADKQARGGGCAAVRRGSLHDCAVEMRSSGGRRARAAAAEQAAEQAELARAAVARQ